MATAEKISSRILAHAEMVSRINSYAPQQILDALDNYDRESAGARQHLLTKAKELSALLPSLIILDAAQEPDLDSEAQIAAFISGIIDFMESYSGNADYPTLDPRNN